MVMRLAFTIGILLAAVSFPVSAQQFALEAPVEP